MFDDLISSSLLVTLFRSSDFSNELLIKRAEFGTFTLSTLFEDSVHLIIEFVKITTGSSSFIASSLSSS